MNGLEMILFYGAVWLVFEKLHHWNERHQANKRSKQNADRN